MAESVGPLRETGKGPFGRGLDPERSQVGAFRSIVTLGRPMTILSSGHPTFLGKRHQQRRGPCPLTRLSPARVSRLS